MWNLPPYPPKDYVLTTVPRLQRDSPQFAPNELPRVSQNNLGIFCTPVQYPEGEVPERIELEAVSPYLMNKWTDELRAFWVDQPGKNDFFIHNMHKKYSFMVGDNDARFKHGEKPFNRSYTYELDCMEEKRLAKVRKKCARDFNEYEELFQIIEDKEKAKAPPPFPITPCKAEAPFWWEYKRQIVDLEKEYQELRKKTRKGNRGKRGPLEDMSLRWTEEPNLTAQVMDDPCLRRKNMLIVGQPFKNEAINWYYENYPPPNLQLHNKKFV